MYKEKRKWQASCPILKMSVKWVSTILGHVSEVINMSLVNEMHTECFGRR